METIYISIAAKGTMESLNSAARGKGEVERLPFDHASETVDALTQAESFISGFESDPLQKGVGDILASLRAAIPRERARRDILAALKLCVIRDPSLKSNAMVAEAIAKAEPSTTAAATNRPGDQAAIYAEETGIDYATALVRCNID
ncbi:MAG: hypothetical protein E5X00_18295 [Mesorhizobium sp.]|nr:MAG: hypothetical protein E5X00_18295 [Mesorhizobium sp.]